jgi:hypothetical protein
MLNVLSAVFLGQMVRNQIEFLEMSWYVTTFLSLFKVRLDLIFIKVTRSPCKLPTDVQKVLPFTMLAN